MKRYVFLLVPLFLLAFSSDYAPAQSRNEVRRIDAYSRQIDGFAKRNRRAKLVFADVSAAEKAQWRKFASEEALEKFRETTETYTIALVWREGARPVHALFTLFSESGDWAQYDGYYYRADGSLAKISSELRTFYGNLIVLRHFYFDRRGKMLKKRIRYRDLNTGKTIKKPEGDLFENAPKLYKRVKNLPFAKLLSKGK